MTDFPDGVLLAFSAAAYADSFPAIGGLTLAQGLVDLNGEVIPAITHDASEFRGHDT